jgi:hypothetical protein
MIYEKSERRKGRNRIEKASNLQTCLGRDDLIGEVSSELENSISAYMVAPMAPLMATGSPL